MTSRNGKKPPNPQKAPRSNGRRPSSPATARRSNGHRPAAPPPRTSSRSTCDCPMAAAVQSVKHGKLRLAARYARLSVRLIAARVA